jgi:hypothetical protein
LVAACVVRTLPALNSKVRSPLLQSLPKAVLCLLLPVAMAPSRSHVVWLRQQQQLFEHSSCVCFCFLGLQLICDRRLAIILSARACPAVQPIALPPVTQLQVGPLLEHTLVFDCCILNLGWCSARIQHLSLIAVTADLQTDPVAVCSV